MSAADLGLTGLDADLYEIDLQMQAEIPWQGALDALERVRAALVRYQSMEQRARATLGDPVAHPSSLATARRILGEA